ncbi:MAG: hypothetical protein KAU90_08330 [Sulfurovaceae bacterium]|nr:hypothetical protein [Sulfurovaceae bacterium]
MCKLCELRGKTWNGDDPVCAFDKKGMLKKDLKDNWKCATLVVLREISYNKDRVIFSDDENSSILDHEGNFIFLKWYKSRGRTDYTKIINENINCDDLGKRTDEEICLEIAYANIKGNMLYNLYKCIDNKDLLYDTIANAIFIKLYKKGETLTNKEIEYLFKKIISNSIYGIFGGKNNV